MQTLETLLEITVYSTVLFLATALAKWALRGRLSPFMHYALWSLFLLRLLLPVTVESPVRLLPPLPAAQQAAAPVPAGPAWAGVPMDAETAGGAALEPPAQPTVLADAPALERAEGAALSAARPKPPLPTVLLAVWLSGAGLGLAYLLMLYIRLRLRIRRQAVPPATRLRALYDEVREELGIRASVPLLCQYGLPSPGILFPACVLMPMESLAVLDEAQIKNVLRHELTHFKRGDHFVSILLSVLNAVYWFHPAVWIAVQWIRRDMERACDSAVVRRMRVEEKGAYAALILTLLSRTNCRQAVLGMAHGRSLAAAEQRIRGIFMNNTSKPAAKIACAALSVALSVACFTTACAPQTVAASDDAGAGEPVQVAAAGSVDGAAVTGDAFLAALEETPFSPVDGSARIVREAVALNEYRQLAFDAAVIVPEAAGYSVARLVSHPFSDEAYLTFLNYFAPDAAWHRLDRDTLADMGALNIGALADDTFFVGQATDASGVLHHMQAQKGSNTFYYNRLLPDQVTYTRSFIGSDKEMQAELAAFDAEWPFPRERALAEADRAVAGLGIEGMHLVHAEEAVTFQVRDGTAIPVDRGWEAVYARGVGGLVHWNPANGYSGGMEVAYDMPLCEYLRICVDGSGVAEFCWSGACEQAGILFHNVAVLPPETVADLVTERLGTVYRNEPNGSSRAHSTFTVTELRLCAAVIGDAPNGRQHSHDRGTDGLLVPAWEAIIRVESDGGAPNASHTTCTFNAVDGGALYGRSMG